MAWNKAQREAQSIRMKARHAAKKKGIFKAAKLLRKQDVKAQKTPAAVKRKLLNQLSPVLRGPASVEGSNEPFTKWAAAQRELAKRELGNTTQAEQITATDNQFLMRKHVEAARAQVSARDDSGRLQLAIDVIGLLADGESLQPSAYTVVRVVERILNAK